MGKNCTQCGQPVKDFWTACYHCLTNLDSYKLYLSEKDLAEFCEAICELEFTYDNPDNEKYFDFFMLFKNLFDAMSYYVYNDGPITRIAEFYMFISPFFQTMSKFINSELLHDRMKAVLKCVWTPLKEQGVFDLIDGVKAMHTLPQMNEKEKREQHLKSQIWWLGTTINISLRGAEYRGFPKTNPLLRGMFDLLALLRRGVYGLEGIDAITEPFRNLKKEWKKQIEPYKDTRDMWSSPLIENMKIASEKISKILKE